jgi:F-type H+-transporting ATPase subunit b
MNFLIPDSGLLFWMILSFGVVFFVLAKYGFPVIIKMVEERQTYIEESLFHAQKARDQLEQLKKTQAVMIEEARNEHQKIIEEAREIREGIISDARIKALKEVEHMLNEARNQILREKEEALTEISSHVAELTMEVAEKVIRKELSDKQHQMELIHQLLDDVNKHQS